MSYEGYRQILCKNGHCSTEDAHVSYYDDTAYPWICSICGAEEAWSNGVDTTNGSYDFNPDTQQNERIDGFVELEIDQPAQFCKCASCGHEHVVTPATYKVPDKASMG